MANTFVPLCNEQLIKAKGYIPDAEPNEIVAFKTKSAAMNFLCNHWAEDFVDMKLEVATMSSPTEVVEVDDVTHRVIIGALADIRYDESA